MPRATGTHRLLVSRLLVLAAAIALLAVGGNRLVPRAEPAAAAVGHVAGYQATVLGFTSWYGSYDLGDLGTAWCVDHGIRAPDPALAYVATTLEASPDTQAALAWAFGRHGVAPDRPTSAALMLVAHDLIGAVYPYGHLDVDALGPANLAGFGADGDAVLAAARAAKADALAHAALRPPWALEVTAEDPPPGGRGTFGIRLTAGGVPVEGIAVQLASSAPSFDGLETVDVVTDADGRAAVGFTAVNGPYRMQAATTVPDLALQAFAPTVARAQRVVRPATLLVRTIVDRAGVAPTTTTSTSTTTTTAPTTTSTSTSTTSTSSTSTTSTSTTSTSTTAPPATSSTSTTITAAAIDTTTTTTAPTPTVALGSSTPRTLPRTGTDTAALTCTGAGLVLLGVAIRPRRVLTSKRDHP